MNINRYDTARATALALAHDVFVQGSQRGKLHVAVSGGSTPKLLFELIAAAELSRQIRWDNIHLYWVDERCVPPTDSESNYGMTRDALLSHIPLKEEQIHRIHGENAPEDEASRYTSLVCSHLPLNESGQPIFDVVILGMGADGHTSSIFPHQMELLHESKPYVVAYHPTTGQRRIAMTGPTILVARQLILHTVGADKGVVLRQIKAKAIEAKNYPTDYIIEHRRDILVYTDQEV